MLAMQGEHYVNLGLVPCADDISKLEVIAAWSTEHAYKLGAPFLHTQTSDLDWRQGLGQQCRGCIALLPAAHRQG